MSPAALFRYLVVPLHPASFGIIVVFAVLITAAELNGLWGLPLVVILGSWFFKFGFAILEDVMHGKRKPPLLSMEMVNPFQQRPLGLLAILLLFYALTDALHPWLRDAGVTIVRIISLSILPAMIGSMVANGRFRDAFDPVAVFGTIARIPLAYAMLLISIGSMWLIAAWLFKSAPFTFDDLWRKENFLPAGIVMSIGFDGLLASLLRLTALMYLWLAMFACIGGTIYERRKELDFEASASPERAAARANRELERERDKLMDRILAEVRGGAFANAGEQVRALIDRAPQPLDEGRWLYARATAASDQRLAEYLADLILDRLLPIRATGDALTIVRERIARNADYKPRTAGRALQLAQLARDAGDKPLARKLLSDFDGCYPNDPLQPVAAKLSLDLQR